MGASLVAQLVKKSHAVQETACNRGDPLEEGMATHSSILAWEILWSESLVGYSPWGHKELDTSEAT